MDIGFDKAKNIILWKEKEGIKKIKMEISKTSQDKRKKVAMLIAFKNFRDEEFFITKEILEKEGINIDIFSADLGIAMGSQGGEVAVDKIIDKIEVSNYDAIVFIGGSGCLKYLDNKASYKIIQETISQGKILASICISPVILAKSGVLKGKNATVWSSELDKNPIRVLEKEGAVYQDNPVVVDGNIITGNGPLSVRGFGEAIVKKLTETQK
ncbi:MAG: DJ-1/PfpI family protein [Patescibacteria group bacterium]|nr:DJ-1/PfpI family protein [Patescibacteria group bacterium]